MWHGYASVRDYQVEEAKKNKEGLEIRLIPTGEVMFVPFEKLGEGKKSPNFFRSKHENKTYYLIDYVWKPDDSQGKLI